MNASSFPCSARRAPVMVFAGSFWNGSTAHGLSEGFRRLGWVVQEIDVRDYVESPRGSMAAKVLARVEKRARRTSYSRAIVDACRHLAPDVFFTVKANHITERVLSELSSAGTRTVCFYPDFHFRYNALIGRALFAFDFFITSKRFHLPVLIEEGLGERSCFVAHGYDDNAHAPIFSEVGDEDYSADVRYIGTCSPEKQRWLGGLQRALPDATLRIIGHGWSGERSRSLPEEIFEAPAYLAASYSLAIQTARINVAVHWGPSREGWQDSVSTRTFEIPAAGGFMLHVDNEEVREYFDVGKEIDVFSSVDELAEKCRYYLRHDDERRRIAQRGHERCVPHYSYAARAREIDAAMGSHFSR